MKIILIIAVWNAASVHSTTTITKIDNQNHAHAHERPNDYNPSTPLAHARLSNGYHLPLIGIGVGNLQHELIVPQISAGIARFGTTLIDTAIASRNEHLVARGVRQGVRDLRRSRRQGKDGGGGDGGTRGNVRSRKDTPDDGANDGDGDRIVIDIVTKVWYTHLGYERTTRAVMDTLDNLTAHVQLTDRATGDEQDEGQIDINLHILLHWPRCRHDISWMRCEEEEDELPDDVRRLGPPPHLHPDTAFIDSWKALQDLYRTHRSKTHDASTENGGTTTVAIASIGVSNFSVHDLSLLPSTPHLLQANLWSYLFDPTLRAHCRDHEIHIQTYNVMNGVLSTDARSRAPRSAAALDAVAKVVRADPPQVLLHYLLREGEGRVSVVARTTSLLHLERNALDALVGLMNPDFEGREMVHLAVLGLMEGHDSPKLPDFEIEQPRVPKVKFVNGMVDEIVHLFWVDGESGEEHRVAEVGAGEEVVQNSFPGHVFVAYGENSGGSGDGSGERKRKEFTVGGGDGDDGNARDDEFQEFHVEF